jgi:hypothetical protein
MYHAMNHQLISSKKSPQIKPSQISFQLAIKTPCFQDVKNVGHV